MCCLQEEITEPKFILLKLRPNLPMTKLQREACWVQRLKKKGFMSKMQVYSSGAIKLKLGDTLYNVSTITQILR